MSSVQQFGNGGWRGDGTDGQHCDYNNQQLQATIVEVKTSITNLTETIENIQVINGDDAHFVFTQNLASSSWAIQHNLGKFPAVTVVDSSGHEVVGDVQHTDKNNLTIFFSAPFAGSAYLN